MRRAPARAPQLVVMREMAATGRARALRIQARLSLGEVAEDIGTSVSTLSRWETGLRPPRGDAALRWLALLRQLDGLVSAA